MMLHQVEAGLAGDGVIKRTYQELAQARPLKQLFVEQANSRTLDGHAGGDGIAVHPETLKMFRLTLRVAIQPVTPAVRSTQHVN